jgi:hypothetical protein
MRCKARTRQSAAPVNALCSCLWLRSRDVRDRNLTPRGGLIGLNFSAKLAKMTKETQEKSSFQLRLIPCEEVPGRLKLMDPKASLSPVETVARRLFAVPRKETMAVCSRRSTDGESQRVFNERGYHSSALHFTRIWCSRRCPLDQEGATGSCRRTYSHITRNF